MDPMHTETVAKREAPIYRELADEVQKLIDKRSLRVGQRLPSVRVTARQRQISIGTVMQAYVVLENRGYIEARPKSGYYVRRRPQDASKASPGSVLGPAVRIEEKDLTEHMMDLSLDPTYFPLGNAFPAPGLLGLEKVARVAAAVARSDSGILGRYALGRSYQPFVQELSRRYFQSGTALGHEDFIVTSSCSEALHLALGSVARAGDVVIVESPAYFNFLRIISSLGLKAIEVPVDQKRGLSLEALKVALDGNDAKAVIVTPNFHNPTGACMPNSRKEELYSILCDYDIPAIEDDIYADLHYGPVRPKPLKAWDRDGRVLLCSSLSKTVGPGLSLGWISAGRYRDQIDDAKWSNTPLYPQKVALHILQEGYDRHLRRLRSEFERQVAAVSTAVRTYFPKGTRVTDPAGGFVLWVELPPAVDAVRLRHGALKEKIVIAPGPIFSVRDQFRNCIRINCGVPWSSAFERAIQTLGRLAHEQVDDGAVAPEPVIVEPVLDRTQ
jgi:DNA-binding transcriptional MocR family regulator